jgi:HSP20 family protein
MPIDTATDNPFGTLAREMSRMLERMGKNYSNFFPGEAWHPNVNLYETETALLVCIDLAGIDKDSVDLQFAESRLLIHGRRDVPRCLDDIHDADSPHTRAKIHLMEIDHGPFVREIELPCNVEETELNLAYRAGLLWIEAKKK